MSEVPLTAQTFHNVSSLHFFSHIIPPFNLDKSQKKNRNKWVFSHLLNYLESQTLSFLAQTIHRLPTHDQFF